MSIILFSATVIGTAVACHIVNRHCTKGLRLKVKDLGNMYRTASSRRIDAEATATAYKSANYDLRHRIHELERRDKSDEFRMTIKNLRDRLRHLRKVNTELVDRSLLNSDILSIKFTAHIPEVGWKRTEFKLGLGPCGLTVSALGWEELEDRYVLTQRCTNGEIKEFTYMKQDVAGRLEIRKGKSNWS